MPVDPAQIIAAQRHARDDRRTRGSGSRPCGHSAPDRENCAAENSPLVAPAPRSITIPTISATVARRKK